MKKDLIPILLVSLVNVLGFSIIIPILPFIVERYGAADIWYGIILSIYSFFQFLGSPFMGSLSDRFGRKPILIASHAGTLLSWVIFGIAWFIPDRLFLGMSLPILVIIFSRIADGITGGNMSVANAYISDISTAKERSKTFGYIGATFGFGFIIGPALGGWAGSTSIGYLGTVISGFIISAVTLVMMFFYLKESLPPEKREDHVELNLWKNINVVAKFKNFASNAYVKFILLLRSVFTVAMNGYTSIIVLFLIDTFLLDERGVGTVLLVAGIFMIINQLYLVGKISDRIGELKTLLAGLVITSIGLVLITLTDNLFIYFILYYILSFGLSLCLPVFKSILSQEVDERKQGAILGLEESIRSLGSAVMPAIATALYIQFGAHAFWIFSGFNILAVAVLSFANRSSYTGSASRL